MTCGKSKKEIQDAFRKKAAEYHPDKIGGDKEKFQLANEACEFLLSGSIPKIPLLANDELVIACVGRKVEPLLNRQKEWDEYDKWSKDKFFGIGVV
ncbi:MAG: DnaJ domain-containing protein [Lentisphaerae bacterium]|nr:DnaJ domain-containing protein [Lentisphaerota bacterium]